MKIDGKQHYLWRAVDQDGEVVDVFLQRRRDGNPATRFFKRLLKTHRDEPRKIVTDKLRSYGVAHRELIPESIHDTKIGRLSRRSINVFGLTISDYTALRTICAYLKPLELFEQSHLYHDDYGTQTRKQPKRVAAVDARYTSDVDAHQASQEAQR